MEVVFAVAVGMLAGFLNTVASGGSAVSLPMLLFMGLSPVLANGTNRVPVVVCCLVATITFMRKKIIKWPLAIKIIVPSAVGSLLGVYFANSVDARAMRLLIASAVLVALLLLFTGIKQALQKNYDCEPRYRLQEMVYLFLVGLWIGFIVVDGNTYLLLVLILGMQLDFVRANAYKCLVALVSSGVSLAAFAAEGNVDWKIGGLVAVGSLAGGFFGAKATLLPGIKVWVFRILVAVLVFELANMAVQFIHT